MTHREVVGVRNPHLDTMTILTKIKHMGMTMRMMLGIVHREGAPPPD